LGFMSKVVLLYRSFALAQLAATDLHWFKMRSSSKKSSSFLLQPLLLMGHLSPLF
jgi:hypothetical protein